MKSAVIIWVVIFGFTSLATASPTALQVGEPFVKARDRLYAAGWRPDPRSHASSGDYMGVDRLLVQKGYMEVDYCSAGRSFCILQYTKGAKCLRVQTQGEDIHSMVVERWSSDCRERGTDEQAHILPADVRYLVQWRHDCEQFGQCDGIDKYYLKIKKKYQRDHAVRAILDANQITSDPKR